MVAAEWTSLEVVHVIVDVLVPIAVVVLGVAVARSTSRIAQSQWANQKVVETRLDIFREVAPKLNKLVCFSTFVGSWKEIEPQMVIRMKRELDETMHVNRILFSAELFDSYDRLMRTMFEMFAAPDRDAPIRAHITHSLGDRRRLPWWTKDHEDAFAHREVPTLEEIRTAYDELGEHFRRDLFVTRDSDETRS